MLGKLRNFLLFDTSSCGDKKKVRDRIFEENRRFAVIWSEIEIIYWGYCLFMSFRQEDYRLCRPAYLAAMIAGILALFFAALVTRKAPRLTHLAKALVKLSLLGGSILIAWFLIPKGYNTIMIFASVLIVPTFFIDNSLTDIIVALAGLTAAVVLLRFGLTPEDYRWTVTNVVIFSSMGVLLGHFINKTRFERYVFAESAVQLAESNAILAELRNRYAYYDQLTGLLNRHAFSEKTEEYAKNPPPYCCIVMLDINGLKETNDELGHEAGDELIVGTAECIKKGFPDSEEVFRLGGDEFCVILTDPGTDVEGRLKVIETECGVWKGQYVNGISVSYGYDAEKNEGNLDEILKSADQRMYEFKRNYYLTTGKDRRHIYE